MQDAPPRNSQEVNRYGEVDIRWLVAGRLCVLSLVLLGASIQSTFATDSSSTLLVGVSWAMAGFFLFSALSAWWLRAHAPTRLFTAVQISADLLLITLLIYATGGPVSPFLFLYLPLVMAVALLMSRRAALTFSGIATALYSAVALSLLRGIIPPGDPSIPITSPSGGMGLQLLGLFSGMVLIAIATSFLKRQVVSTYALAEQSKRDLQKRDLEQRALMNGLQDGVVMLSVDGAITLVNQAARELLRLGNGDLTGKTLNDVLGPEHRELKTTKLSYSEPIAAKDIEFTPPGTERPVKLRFLSTPLFDDVGLNTGAMLIFQDVTDLRTIEEQLRVQERLAQLLAAKDPDSSRAQSKLRNFVGESPVMQKVFGLIDRIAASEATVLISGESGTGKELVAKAIHFGSAHSKGPFVPVNCGAIPENLIESELFGHKKGSFTGADQDAAGLFRTADNGTLFLDEIGELPLQMQAKLLRALQEKKVRPVGGDRDLPVNVRVITATNRNLRREIDQGNFREDLYYRLNVINVQLPPLRERKEDVPLLVNSILRALVKDRKIPIVPPATMKLLLDYSYPGNVRELENILERALVLGGEAILPEHLPDTVRESSAAISKPETHIIVDEGIDLPANLDSILANIERKYLEAALIKTKGAKKKAADLLGINFRSFRYRLQKFGISDDGEDSTPN
ncbi:MAG: sigma 54-interacting transcriptional regulator [Oligoflexia bacterium]|nr:sigma 54-interacting transcriptional regulator [Oligoflexia bacterium]